MKDIFWLLSFFAPNINVWWVKSDSACWFSTHRCLNVFKRSLNSAQNISSDVATTFSFPSELIDMSRLKKHIHNFNMISLLDIFFIPPSFSLSLETGNRNYWKLNSENMMNGWAVCASTIHDMFPWRLLPPVDVCGPDSYEVVYLQSLWNTHFTVVETWPFMRTVF